MVKCSVEGCSEWRQVKGLCNMHYHRLRRFGDPEAKVRAYGKRGATPICTITGCENATIARGWCSKHYKRWQQHGDPLILQNLNRELTCSIDGCAHQMVARGWCSTHYSRWRRYGDPLREPPALVRRTTWRTNNHGYVVRYWPEHSNASPSSGIVLQHVAVMADHLGRPLRKGETVHHKNGVRDDNRLENLELWASAHPPGQRVSELIAWAHELLEQYRDDLPLWPDGLQP